MSFHVYQFVRCRPWDQDRFMAPDIEAVKELLREGKIWHAVQQHINHYSHYQVK